MLPAENATDWPANSVASAFPYQVRAAQAALRRFRGRGLLCDEAGMVLKEYLAWARFPTHEAIVAYVLASRERQLAMRVWELDPDDGILITCQCELGPACPADGQVMRPAAAGAIEQQILDEIALFRQEYGLPAKKVGLNRSLAGQIVPVARFGLFGRWKDPVLISQAQASFDHRYRR